MAQVVIDENKIPELLDALEDNIKVALEAIGGDAEDAAVLQCPVDTGNLAGSIKHGLADSRTTYIGTAVEYSPYVEFNDNAKHTVGKAHFLRDALLDNRDRYKQILESIFSGN